MTDRELMLQALVALEDADRVDIDMVEAIDALRKRLAQPKDWQYVQKLNAFSYPRPWVGLDDDEYQTILGQLGDAGLLAFYNLIESKLKDKNGG
jgi:hypothetical protein